MIQYKFLPLYFFLLNSILYSQAPDTMWTKSLGGVGDDKGYFVQQTTDGGYIIVGTTSWGNDSLNVLLIKTNDTGEPIWTKTFPKSRDYLKMCVQQTTDGGYIIVGSTDPIGIDSSDIRLIKTNTVGYTLWTKTFGGSGDDIGYAVQQTVDGGYIIIGSTESFGSGAWLIKTDSNGDTLWTKIFQGSVGLSVQQTSDEGYIITGGTVTGSGDVDVWINKTDNNGISLWTKTFGGSVNDLGFCVQQTSEGGYIIAGLVGEFRALLLKTDANGNTLWSKNFGGSFFDIAYSVQQAADGGYIIVGHFYVFEPFFNYDIFCYKTDGNGNTLWTGTYRGLDSDYGYSVQQTSDGGYIITGSTYSSEFASQNVWLIKIAPDITAIDEAYQTNINNYHLQQNYPNPFNPTTKINYQLPNMSLVILKVYDVLGKEIATLVNEEKPAGSYEVEFDATQLSSGIYFYKLQAGEFVETKKMIYLK